MVLMKFYVVRMFYGTDWMRNGKRETHSDYFVSAPTKTAAESYAKSMLNESPKGAYSSASVMPLSEKNIPTGTDYAVIDDRGKFITYSWK